MIFKHARTSGRSGTSLSEKELLTSSTSLLDFSSLSAEERSELERSDACYWLWVEVRDVNLGSLRNRLFDPFFWLHFSEFFTSETFFRVNFSGFTFSTLRKIFLLKMLGSLDFEKNKSKNGRFPGSRLASLLQPTSDKHEPIQVKIASDVHHGIRSYTDIVCNVFNRTECYSSLYPDKVYRRCFHTVALHTSSNFQ